MKVNVSSILVALISLLTVAANAQFGDRILINGYSSFEFEKQLGDEGKGDPNGSFDADLFDLVFNVYATDNLRVAADFSWEHGAATEDGRGNVVIEYGFGEYSIIEAIRIRAGKMFTHFGIYNEIHTAKPAFLSVKEPLSTNKNQKFGSEHRFYPRWLTGMAVLGSGVIGELEADYMVQIANGEQEYTNPFEEDDNSSKAISARGRIFPVNDLEIGASVFFDQLSEPDSLGEPGNNRTNLFSFGGHVQGSVGVIGIEAEYVHGTVESSFADKITRYGLTGMLYLPINDVLIPYVRYELLDPNTKISDDTARQIIPGLNIQIDDGLFFKLELNMVSSGENNNRFTGTSYSELKAAIAIGF